MKQHIKKLLVIIMIIFASFTLSSSTLYAADDKNGDDNTEETSKPSDNGKKDTCEAYGAKDSDAYYECIADRKASVTTSNFISSAIYSMNLAVRGEEISDNPDYIKNFFNSAQTALVYGINILDPDTIIMNIIGMLIGILEGIGCLITLIVMVLFNTSSTTFWQETIGGVFDTLDKIIFDWSNPNSIFIKIVIFFALFAMAQKFIKNFKRIYSIKDIFNIVFSTVLSVALVMGIAKFGKPIMDGIETKADSFVAGTLGTITEKLSDDSFGETNYEIATKSMIFEAMQAQGFRLRNFGVTSIDQIKGDDKEKRYNTLLNDPSRENAKKERKEYESSDIIYNSQQALVVFAQSLIFFIHRILMAIVIGAGCLIVLFISIFKVVLLSVSIYALIKCIIDPDRKSAMMWFFNRLQWLLLSEASKLVSAFIIYLVINTLNAVTQSSFGLLVILPFDLVIVLAMWYLVKNAPRMLQKVLATLGSEDASVVGVATNFLKGHQSPKELFEKMRSEFKQGEDGKEKSNSEDVDEEEQGSTESKISNIQDSPDINEENDIIQENDNIDNEKIDESFDSQNDDEHDLNINEEFEKIKQKNMLEHKDQSNKTIDKITDENTEEDSQEQSHINNLIEEDSQNDNVKELEEIDPNSIEASHSFKDNVLKDNKQKQYVEKKDNDEVEEKSKLDKLSTDKLYANDNTNQQIPGENKLGSNEEKTKAKSPKVEKLDELSELVQVDQEEVESFDKELSRQDKEELDEFFRELTSSDPDEDI